MPQVCVLPFARTRAVRPPAASVNATWRAKAEEWPSNTNTRRALSGKCPSPSSRRMAVTLRVASGRRPPAVLLTAAAAPIHEGQPGRAQCLWRVPRRRSWLAAAARGERRRRPSWLSPPAVATTASRALRQRRRPLRDACPFAVRPTYGRPPQFINRGERQPELAFRSR